MKKYWLLIIFGLVIIALVLLIVSEKNLHVISPDTTPPTQTSASSSLENKDSKSISTVILPHFDFAKSDRQKMVGSLSKEVNPKTIILVSVNHYDTGQNEIQTTDKTWDFSTTKASPNKEVINNLDGGGLVINDEAAFVNEHGIFNVLPDLATSFPKAEFVPIIIKSSTEKDKIDQLLAKLMKVCPKCLLVASIDFSHYNPNSLAQIHDLKSLAALNNLDANKAWDAETDSPQTFYLALNWASKHNDQKFNLVAHSNSGEASKQNDIETTSYILGYYSNGTKNTADKTSTLLIGGDLMFDRMINHQFKTVGLFHVFDHLGNRVFWGTDISITNLEGPISDKPIDDNISTNNLVFNFPPDTISALKFAKISSVSLANNHTGNAGAFGLENTRSVLDQVGIQWIGGPDQFDDHSVHRYQTDVPISIVTVNMLTNPNREKISSAIVKEHSNNQFVIVFPHWGNEYQPKHSADQADLAHQWIDSGADLVIGSHPHVIQDMEIYQNKPVIYSMGNLVFDQTFSKETQQGLLVAVVVSKQSVNLTLLPVQSKSYMPELLKDAEKQRIISSLLDNLSQSAFTKIRDDTIKINRGN